MRTACLLTALCGVGIAGQMALAAPITVNFTGSFSTVLGNPYAGAANGDTFSGSFTYESSTAPATDDPINNKAFYNSALTAMSVTIQTSGGPVVITADKFSGTLGSIGSPAAGQTVTNDDPDIFNPPQIIDSFHTTAGNTATNTSLFVFLDGKATPPATGPLSSRALPESLDLSQFNSNVTNQFQVNGPGFNIASGQITSLTVVPAPTGGVLLALGAAPALRRRRR